VTHQRWFLIERPDPPDAVLYRVRFPAHEVDVRYDGGSTCPECGCPQARAITTVIGRDPGGLETFRSVSLPGEVVRVYEVTHGLSPIHRPPGEEIER
jgi:hypothetical protein